MSNSSIIVASCLCFLAAAHSVLGELAILRPLFQAEWQKPKPRWAMQRILRFAWHLTSITWVGLAGIALGAPIHLMIAGICVLSAGLVFVSLRGHLSWPFFLLAACAALHTEGLLHTSVLGVAIVLTLLCLVVIAAVHVYWAAGGSWGIATAIPQGDDDKPSFSPPPWLTVLVALALLAFAGLIGWSWLVDSTQHWPRVLLGLGTTVLTLRAVGDGKHAGFTKTKRNSEFAKWDDRLFTPLAVLMAFGSGAALLV